MLDPTYDVFLSVCGPDRATGRVLATELRALGLRVFVDEDRVEPFTGISRSIWGALGASKCLVAYYSAEYAVRPSCQRELMAAFLVGQQEGDPTCRILVINPEPETRHLRPVELADAKFAVPSLGFAEIARLVAKRAAAIDEPIGETQPARPPRLPARLSAHVRNLVGRYTELWDLHTALFGADYPLIEELACGPVASVYGLPGAGKTALVATYAWRFAAAFPGDVRWLTLAGADAATAVQMLREQCAHAGSDMLWVVDDIPEDVDTEALLDALPLVGARTVLISDRDLFRDQLPRVRVGPLPNADATVLLDWYRRPDDEQDETARDEIAGILGGNPAALVAVGRYLRDRHGIASYLSVVDAVRQQEPLVDLVFGRVRRVVNGLGPAERTLLRLVGELGRFSFSAGCLASMPRLAGVDVSETLATLLARTTVRRIGSEWRFDPLIVHAASGLPIQSRQRET